MKDHLNPTVSTKPVRVEMLGGLRIVTAKGVIDRFPKHRAAALLARLAFCPGRANPREELMDIFWPDLEEEAARNNLRQTLHVIRKMLTKAGVDASSVLQADNTAVRASLDTVVSDVEEFQSALNSDPASDPESAVRLYCGELLPGFYDEWILPERRRLEVLYLGALRTAQTRCCSAGKPERALDFALRAAAVDPLDEQAHISIMRLHAALGDPAAVRRQYEGLIELMHKELGEAPTFATEALVDEICAEATKHAPVLSPRPMRTIPTAHDAESHNEQPSFGFLQFFKPKRAFSYACASLALVALFSPLPFPHGPSADAAFHIGRQQADDIQLGRLRELRTRMTTSIKPAKAELCRIHAETCVALAEKAWNGWYGRDEALWLDRFSTANEDLRQALRWLVENDAAKAMQLSGTLARFWYMRGYSREGYGWLRQSLEAGSNIRSSARARALVGFAFLSPAYDSRARSACGEGLSNFERCGDKWGAAHALRHLGYIDCANARRDTAARYYARALRIYEEIREERGQAVTQLCICFLPSEKVDPKNGPFRLEAGRRSLALFRKLGNSWGVSMSLQALGTASADLGDHNAVHAYARQAFSSGSIGESAPMGVELARMIMERDNSKRRKLYRQALQKARDAGNKSEAACLLENAVSLQRVDPIASARLFGAVIELDRSLQIETGHRLDFVKNYLVARLGEPAFERSYKSGKALTWEEAVEEAVKMN